MQVFVCAERIKIITLDVEASASIDNVKATLLRCALFSAKERDQNLMVAGVWGRKARQPKALRAFFNEKGRSQPNGGGRLG